MHIEELRRRKAAAEEAMVPVWASLHELRDLALKIEKEKEAAKLAAAAAAAVPATDPAATPAADPAAAPAPAEGALHPNPVMAAAMKLAEGN